jgi:hypothetical protein
MLHELLKMTVDSQVTLPSDFTIAFVDIEDVLAQESALLTINKKKISLTLNAETYRAETRNREKEVKVIF